MAGSIRGRPGYETLAAELKKGTVRPAYLFWGEEAFLVSRATQEVIRAVFGDRDPGLGLVRWDLQAGTLGHAIRDAEELSLLGQRVVVFEGVTSRDNWGYAKLHVKKPEKERLQRYVADPNPSSVLILTGSVADYSAHGLATLAPKLHIYHFGTPDDERLAKWAAGKAGALGFRLSPAAVTALLALSKGSMLTLASEIEKLCLYLEPGATAEAGDVFALGEGSADENVYEITDAIGAGDAKRALATMRRVSALHADGGTRVLSELRRSFTLWFRLREALDRGEGPQTMASSLRTSPYVVQRNLSSARRYGVRALEDFLRRLCLLERSMKSGSTENVGVELLVLDASREAGRPAV